ncbi:hypothetical protein DPSP01_000536 [Paraphaeosphaeria sporulosa]
MYLTHLLLPFALLPNISALKIATSLQWIEHTPQAYAIKNFYKGSSPATLSSGGVANLASDSSIDLAANAETQGLKQYANHKSLRLIYIITEVSYRLVARSSSPANVKSLADLKGKKIGSMPGTSAAIFVQRMLASAGVNDGAYSIVSGNVCMKAPCGSGTLPAMLKGGQVDAFGIWEPAVELGIRAIGKDNAVVFQNGMHTPFPSSSHGLASCRLRCVADPRRNQPPPTAKSTASTRQPTSWPTPRSAPTSWPSCARSTRHSRCTITPTPACTASSPTESAWTLKSWKLSGRTTSGAGRGRTRS